MALSARAHDKILRFSRTIADLEHSDNINSNHLSEAINYRTLDRSYWKYVDANHTADSRLTIGAAMLIVCTAFPPRSSS